MSIILSAFPGTGKTHFYNLMKDQISVLDSDSSKYSWLEPGVRNPEFPRNYLQHIQENSDTTSFIMVSTHKDVRDLLTTNGIHYYLVYPWIGLKEEYLERYRQRGSSEDFIQMMSKNWEIFIRELDLQRGCSRFCLEQGDFISNLPIFSKFSL